MGKRRVRLIQKYIKEEVHADRKEKWQIIGVDSNPDRCRSVAEDYGIESFSEIKLALEAKSPEAAVISTSPLSHAGIIKNCLENGLHVFTEINLVDDGYGENIALAGKNKRVLFLSSTPMYRKEMKYIIREAKERGFHGTYRYHVGQYLPEWHPWENYKDFFVGDKRTSGCREILAIELPWLIKAYGDIIESHCMHSKTTSLNIEYDDTYQIIVSHGSGVIGSITVDVSTPRTERLFSAWEENYYLEWRGTPDTFRILDINTGELLNVPLYRDIEHTEGYNQFVVENAYYDEIKEYICCIRENRRPDYGFDEDRTVLEKIDEIMTGGHDDK